MILFMHDLLHARSHGHEHAYYKSIIIVLVYGYDNMYRTQMKLCRIDKKHDAHVSCCINNLHEPHRSHQRNIKVSIHGYIHDALICPLTTGSPGWLGTCKGKSDP